MNLQPLFETQKKLDDRIVKEKGLEGVDLLDKKILALQVELGELANEWEMFKFWKDNPKPNIGRRISIECGWCEGTGRLSFATDEHCDECEGTGLSGRYSVTSNKVLEEYVDCLHFILSIGNDCQFDDGFYYTSHTDSVLEQFNYLFNKIGDFYLYRTTGSYTSVFNYFLALGDFLGFTWEQIEQAYYEKNKINHERQTNGY